MKKGTLLLILFFLLGLQFPVPAQRVTWKRARPRSKGRLQLFHSSMAFNLPTAETLHKGNLEFEISHRFVPSVSEGVDALYGLDGPVNMRIALAYGVTNRVVVTLGRSNVDDNLDFQLKYKILRFPGKLFPFLVGIQVGAAWNSQIEFRNKTDWKNFQFYGRLIGNTLLNKKFGFGIVVSYLENSRVRSADRPSSSTLGGYFQYYASRFVSFLLEWNPTISGFHHGYNSFSLGMELETGGHFFKILATNNATLNPGQFTVGADRRFTSGNLRLGFNVTRLFSF